MSHAKFVALASIAVSALLGFMVFDTADRTTSRTFFVEGYVVDLKADLAKSPTFELGVSQTVTERMIGKELYREYSYTSRFTVTYDEYKRLRLWQPIAITYTVGGISGRVLYRSVN